MKQRKMPLLDPRDAEQVFNELIAHAPSLVSEITPVEGGSAHALMQIFSRYMEVIIHRLNEAPDKNLLAFLDMLGINLISPQSARVPVVFEPLPIAGNGRIAANTRLGAQTPDHPDPLMFETENTIAMAASHLVEVKTVWPARDEYADHTMPAAGGQGFSLFESRLPVPHEFYLAHDTLFGFEEGAKVTIEIEFELATPGSVPLNIVWEFWDGQVWRRFIAIDPGDRSASQDSTKGLTKSGLVSLRPQCGQSQKKPINGINAHWVRGRLDQPFPPDPSRMLPEVDRIRVRSRLERGNPADAQDNDLNMLPPDQAFSNGISLDVSQTFFPFGHQPLPGDAFYFSSEEIFSKAGAEVNLVISVTDNAPVSELKLPPSVKWEYWAGRRWLELNINPEPAPDFLGNFFTFGISNFIVQNQMERREVNGKKGLWVRARLVYGRYEIERKIDFNGSGNTDFTIVETFPPIVMKFKLGYLYRSPWESPEHCFSYTDFQYELHTDEVCWPGSYFQPFRPVSDTTPALYLGFDQPLPNDLVSLYLDIEASESKTPLLLWDAWDGKAWREIAVMDETANLSQSGMVSFISPDVAPRHDTSVTQASGNQISLTNDLEGAVFQPGDRVLVKQDKLQEMGIIEQIKGDALLLATPLSETYSGGSVAIAALPRFGVPLDWVRVRLKTNGAPTNSRIHGIHLNATWAVQVKSLNDEVLGSTTGQPGQSFFLSQVPVLPEEKIEVRELEGARAEVELPILKEQLLKQGLTEDDIRTVVDPRSGVVTEVWVVWQFRPHLFYSGSDDRHYMLERTGGRLIFGDGQHGRIPVVGANNILARRYQSGGGLVGNVAVNSITQLLGVAAFVQGVTNPVAAEGGADAETLIDVKIRGPQTIRHRGRALSVADYEALAKQASPGVAIARALSATAPDGRPAPVTATGPALV